MSINHLTNSSGSADTLDIYVKDISARNLSIDGVVQSASDITSYNAQLDYLLSGVTPVGFVSGIPSSYTIHREEKKAYNTNTGLYKYTLDIKGLFSLLVGIPPSVAESIYSMTFDVDPRYLNSIVVYKQGKALNILIPGNVYLDVYQLASVDTSVIGKVTLVFRRDNHNNTPISSTLVNDFYIELVAF